MDIKISWIQCSSFFDGNRQSYDPRYERFNSSPLATRLDSHGFFLRFLAFSLPLSLSYVPSIVEEYVTRGRVAEIRISEPRTTKVTESRRKSFITDSIDRNSKKRSHSFDDLSFSRITDLYSELLDIIYGYMKGKFPRIF